MMTLGLSVTNPASIFRVRAHNTAAESENKIHDDRVAAVYGFRGGLVPGVTVYGYMVPAIIDRFGRGWIEHGGISVRFLAPCYEGETVVVRCVESTVTAEREDGSIYSSGTVTANSDREPDNYAEHGLPAMEDRPVASSETITPGLRLGSIREPLGCSTRGGNPGTSLAHGQRDSCSQLPHESLDPRCERSVSPWARRQRTGNHSDGRNPGMLRAQRPAPRGGRHEPNHGRQADRQRAPHIYLPVVKISFRRCHLHDVCFGFCRLIDPSHIRTAACRRSHLSFP